jgi:hypothetical protein
MISNICDPVTGEDLTRDPRNIARKAENYLKTLGLADTAYFGLKQSFSYLMMRALIRISMKVITTLILLRAHGILGVRRTRTLPIRYATRRVIFRCLQQTAFRT